MSAMSYSSCSGCGRQVIDIRRVFVVEEDHFQFRVAAGAVDEQGQFVAIVASGKPLLDYLANVQSSPASMRGALVVGCYVRQLFGAVTYSKSV